jgi:hypothetical protein
LGLNKNKHSSIFINSGFLFCHICIHNFVATEANLADDNESDVTHNVKGARCGFALASMIDTVEERGNHNVMAMTDNEIVLQRLLIR